MNPHYGNDELLEQAFIPGENAELALHLAGCENCAQRFAALRDGIDRHAGTSEMPDRPETFWKRQELGVMRAIDRRQARMPGAFARFAAAAAVVFVVVAFWAGRGSVSNTPLTPTVATATVASTAMQSTSASQDNGLTTTQLATDPWESEQLQDFQSVVAWETWVDDDQNKRGTI